MAPVSRQRSRQPDPRLGLHKRVWLLLYAEGGMWTEAEIRAKLGLVAELHVALRGMHEGGFLVRKLFVSIDGEARMKYGVSSRCKFPRGLTVAEAEAAVALARQFA
ncbi:MAG TPA: hypothetical protein VFM98_01755 [Ramlibacter sp.]|uniref:hypothetical protein n=1 Tax=Ramlibacter sp. TaxID=1917967 RepID=UPI002D7F9CE3|nr:hypothetical protein [Ramlibacter sp.]HET8744300.1 hypothetical protein [Ramlibacter sp.]